MEISYGKYNRYEYTRIRKTLKNYDDAELEGLFDTKEFCIALSNLIDSKGHKNRTIFLTAAISANLTLWISKIPSKNIQPKRNKILDLCLGINATKDEINMLLRLAHYQPLDSRGEALDRIIIWGLAHQKDSYEIRSKLYEHGYTDF